MDMDMRHLPQPADRLRARTDRGLPLGQAVFPPSLGVGINNMTDTDMLRELLRDMRVLRSPAAMSLQQKEEDDAAVKMQAVIRGRHARQTSSLPQSSTASINETVKLIK
jgi:hypothetical protein